MKIQEMSMENPSKGHYCKGKQINGVTSTAGWRDKRMFLKWKVLHICILVGMIGLRW